MAEFLAAVSHVLQHEGGFVDAPTDPGGATHFGVSLRWLRGLGDTDGDGWLEGDLDHDGDVDADDIRALTQDQALGLYRTQWWDRYGYGQLADQRLATKIFDLAVNMGAGQAHRLVQRALRAVGKTVREDGVMGPETRAAVDAYAYQGLLPALRSEAAGFYRSLNKPEFVAGWLNRAYS